MGSKNPLPKGEKPNTYQYHFDVVVVGGGLSGIAAAIAADSLGCRVALVHDRPVLGGNSSSEIHVYPYGAAVAGTKRHLRETGIIEHIKQENRRRNPNGSPHMWSLILWEFLTQQSNISLFLNSRVFDIEMHSSSRIKQVQALQVTTNKQMFFEGNIFIDTSGDGVVGNLADAEYRQGREASSEFNEDIAPKKKDKCVLPGSLLFQVEDIGKPSPFIPPAWARCFPKCEDLPYPAALATPYSHGFWWLEWGGQLDNNLEIEDVRDELWRIMMGLWDHMKNRGDHGMQNRAISWIQTVVGKRESRRLMGDHILTQNDIEARPLFPDRVSYGGWPIDIHPPEGIYSKKRPYYISQQLSAPYSIPFRCLYSKNIDNLMFAGRDISVTHVALGSTRVMSTCAALGEAVGVAAYLCQKHRAQPRMIYQQRRHELQQLLLKRDCYIIGIKNEDKTDLARKAKLTASSTKVLKGAGKAHGRRLMDRPRCQLFYLSHNKLDYVDILLESSRTNPSAITLHLCKAESFLGVSLSEKIASCRVTVLPKKKKWYRFRFDKAITPGIYAVWMKSHRQVCWYFSNSEELATNCASFEKQHNIWVGGRGDYCFRISPQSRAYEPANIVSGVSRPDHLSNAWCSDPALPMPQHVVLDFEREKTINTMYITFDTNLSESSDRTPEKFSVPLVTTTKAVSENVVRDYAILYWDKGRWRKIMKIEDNYHRHRVHHFGLVKTSRIKIKILKTNGASSAILYELRAYRE